MSRQYRQSACRIGDAVGSLTARLKPNLLEQALYYRRILGWCIIPINPKTKKPCLKWWKPYQSHLSTEQELQDWFGKCKHTAMAVVLGPVSGNLTALDFDSPETCDWWNTTHPELAGVLPTEGTVRGLHVFFQSEPVATQRPDNQHVELLCKGAYVIITPSPGKHWLIEPSSEIPTVDPFSLGLEAFDIEKTKNGEIESETHFTEEIQKPELLYRRTEEQKNGFSSSVKSAFGENVGKQVENALSRTLPSEIGQRNTYIRILCQWLKSIPELKDRPVADFRFIIEEWYTRALSVIGSKSFETTWGDFSYAWPRIKWPKGTELNRIIEQARADTETPPEAKDYQDERTQLLVRTLWRLQQRAGQTPIFMSVRTAGDIMGLTAPEGAKRLAMLVADRKLVIAQEHTNIRATRFYYVGKRKTGKDTHNDNEHTD